MNPKRAVKRLLFSLSGAKYYFVGLTATGNRTAGKAMSLLGYSWRHYPMQLGDLWRYQVGTDTPVALWFRQGLLPQNSTFILTTRALDPWLEDCQVWFESRPLESLSEFEREMRQFLFGGVTFDRDRFATAYRQHTEECLKVAAKMGVQLHQWNVVAEPNWDFLHQLTGKQTDHPFPFTPGVYDKTWEAVRTSQLKLLEAGQNPEFL